MLPPLLLWQFITRPSDICESLQISFFPDNGHVQILIVTSTAIFCLFEPYPFLSFPQTSRFWVCFYTFTFSKPVRSCRLIALLKIKGLKRYKYHVCIVFKLWNTIYWTALWNSVPMQYMLVFMNRMRDLQREIKKGRGGINLSWFHFVFSVFFFVESIIIKYFFFILTSSTYDYQ